MQLVAATLVLSAFLSSLVVARPPTLEAAFAVPKLADRLVLSSGEAYSKADRRLTTVLLLRSSVDEGLDTRSILRVPWRDSRGAAPASSSPSSGATLKNSSSPSSAEVQPKTRPKVPPMPAAGVSAATKQLQGASGKLPDPGQQYKKPPSSFFAKAPPKKAPPKTSPKAPHKAPPVAKSPPTAAIEAAALQTEEISAEEYQALMAAAGRDKTGEGDSDVTQTYTKPPSTFFAKAPPKAPPKSAAPPANQDSDFVVKNILRVPWSGTAGSVTMVPPEEVMAELDPAEEHVSVEEQVEKIPRSPEPNNIQKLLAECALLLQPGTHQVPTPALEKIQDLLTQLSPQDLGVDAFAPAPESPAPANPSSPNRPPPIRYADIYDSDTFSVTLFGIPPHSRLPLHAHPNMTVISMLVRGAVNASSFTAAPPPACAGGGLFGALNLGGGRKTLKELGEVDVIPKAVGQEWSRTSDPRMNVVSGADSCFIEYVTRDEGCLMLEILVRTHKPRSRVSQQPLHPESYTPNPKFIGCTCDPSHV
jgi:hypothetical protein